MNTPYASASLYIGDLAGDVTEGMLFEIFNQVGPVASIRVCRDAVTRRSLGYAYVNYHNVVDAERAMDTLNNNGIKGRSCRIMWSQRDPSLRKSGVGNIFIKNLDKTIEHKALYDTFSAFGNILSCKVVTDETGQSKGYGFVHFENQDAADKAIARVNGMMLNNQKVYVGPFMPRKERVRGADGETKFTNVYVKNFDESIGVDKLKEMFAEFGTITNAVIMSDHDSRSKGFGFVNFENPESAKKAVDALNNKEYNGKTLFVGRAQKKSEREAELRQKFEQMKLERLSKYQGVNLYVKNLEDSIDDDKLRAEFTPYGSITSCKVMKTQDEKGASKGFGFVCFGTPEEATRAVTELNGRMLGTKPLYVALAQRKDVRKAQLEAQHAQRAKLRTAPPNAMGPMGYPPGAPVFYPPQPGMPPQPGGFVYPQQMLPRGGPRWNGPQAQYQAMPQYVVNVGAQRQQPQGRRPGPGQQGFQGPRDGRGGGIGQGARRGGRGGRSEGGAPGQLPVQLPHPDASAPHPEQQAAQLQAQPLTPQLLAAYPPNEQRMIVGERLYPLIAKVEAEKAGKITGMLLDSATTEELVGLVESPEALHAKIQEALEVLKQHSGDQ